MRQPSTINLVGRQVECDEIKALVDQVREGQSRVLVLHGEAGVGKTALLDHAGACSAGFRTTRSVGIESEMEFPYAALQQLCSGCLDHLDQIPEPQQAALRTAFGLAAGEAPDRFLVGLAVLSLWSEASQQEPLMFVVDDAQWLDRASAEVLIFAARRLLAESVALLFSIREMDDAYRGLPTLEVTGLDDPHARALLSSVLGAPVDEQVRERILAEARGNPLALLELPLGLTTAELASGFRVPASYRSVPGRVEEIFSRRLAALPPQTRRLLVVAAAEPLGDALLLWQAAARVGVGPEAARPAEAAGLLTVGVRVTFRHPLVRAAAYRSADAKERSEVHDALADVTDPIADPDRRIWHRAQAACDPSEEIAAELERSAGRAQMRGGLAAAAAFFERSAALTPDVSRRSQRALAAAQAKEQAGAFDDASRLLATAELGPLSEIDRGVVDLLRGRIAFALNWGRDAPPFLLKAARTFEPLNLVAARNAYLEALAAVLHAGRLSTTTEVVEIARAALSAPQLEGDRSGPDLLLDALSVYVVAGPEKGTPLIKEALGAFIESRLSEDEALRWLWLAGHAAGLVWDYDSWDLLSARFVQLARDSGALSVLPIAHSTRAGVELFGGELRIAASLRDEVTAVEDVTGTKIAPYVALGFAAFAGLDVAGTELAASGTADVEARGEGVGLTFIQWAIAVMANGLGRYEDAFASATEACRDSHVQRFYLWGLVELIEAGARSGHVEEATEFLELLTSSTTAAGTDWAAGTEACARALLSEGDTADSLYVQGIEYLSRTRVRVALARAHLLYGEWLRRERRRVEARLHLRQAHQMFSEFGMDGFAERARGELRASGETARKRAPETRDELSPQQAQIARLVAEGATNREIATQLFISPSTVAYHLREVFRKLGVRSRTQLAHQLLSTS